MQSPSPTRQYGAAILLMLLLLITAGAGILLAQGDHNRHHLNTHLKTSMALARAKDVLLAHATTYDFTHPGRLGFLPCPDSSSDSNPEGREDAGCGATGENKIGRLPWRSLAIPPIKGGDGECLWYAVSSSYKGRATSKLVNADTNGFFEVFNTDGTLAHSGNAEDRIIAVIFAPGHPLGEQDRGQTDDKVEKCGGNYTASNYLEGDGDIDNATLQGGTDVLDQFIRGQPHNPNSETTYNDRLLTITQSELWSTILARNSVTEKLQLLTQTLAECVASYGLAGTSENTLPWPAPVNLNPEYRLDNQYDDANNPSFSLGRLPLIVDDSATEAGRAKNQLFALDEDEDAYCQLDNPAGDNKLWQNWKDHFFLVTSDAFQPGGSGLCDGTNCVTLLNSATEYAAIVFFAGQALTAPRNDPLSGENPGSKHILDNYLEAANNAPNGDPDGNHAYQQGTASGPINDILYCIEPDMDVTLCPST